MSSTTSTPPAESPMKPGDRRLLPPDVRKARLKERMEESEREATEYLNRKFHPESFGPEATAVEPNAN
jgi:hypothetical protein